MLSSVNTHKVMPLDFVKLNGVLVILACVTINDKKKTKKTWLARWNIIIWSGQRLNSDWLMYEAHQRL